MKKILMTIILFMIAISCYSEEDGLLVPFYKREGIKCEYNINLYDSIYVSLVPEDFDAFVGFYIISAETFDIKKNVSTAYHLFFATKDSMANYLLTIESFDRTLHCPSYKHFLENQTKEELKLFECMDNKVNVEDNFVKQSLYYLYIKDL